MKGMGDTTAYLRWGIREIICLALFYFTFLAGEYLFDMRVAEFVPPSEVATYETLIVGASVIGFFVRPILYYRRPRAIDTTSDITGVLLVSALLLMIMAVRFEVVIAGGLMACCTLGYCGSTAHANFARRFARTPYLARAAALSYALGVLLQVFSHMVIPAGIPQQFVFVACAVAQVALLHGVRRAKLRGESEFGPEPDISELSVDASEFGAKWQNDPESTAAFRRAVVRLTIATACLTGVFAALNAGLTISHAAGSVDLGDWSRLLMGVSALLAGALFDLRGRSCMNIIMTCAAMLSTESRSADTVCPAGTGYSGILNSFRRMPLRAFGDFHTTIRIVTDSFLTPAAGAAARDQQERHQKHQQPRRENGRDQDASPQRRRADAQQGASAASSKHTSHAPFSLPVYTSLREWCGTSIRN